MSSLGMVAVPGSGLMSISIPEREISSGRVGGSLSGRPRSIPSSRSAKRNKLGNVWAFFVQLICRPTWTENQLYKSPNNALLVSFCTPCPSSLGRTLGRTTLALLLFSPLLETGALLAGPGLGLSIRGICKRFTGPINSQRNFPTG